MFQKKRGKFLENPENQSMEIFSCVLLYQKLVFHISVDGKAKKVTGKKRIVGIAKTRTCFRKYHSCQL